MHIRPVEEKSLSELLGTEGGGYDASPIGRRVAAASRVPLNELSDSHLALLLRQRFGAHYLAPLAFARLEDDIWMDAGLYRGDLLIALVRNRGRFGHRRDLEDGLQRFLDRPKRSLDHLDEIDRDTVSTAFDQEGIRLG